MIFQRRDVGAADQYGTPSKAWVNICPAMDAEIYAQKGGEQVQAERMTGRTTHKIITRWQPALDGLLSTDRAVEVEGAQRVFNLKSIASPGRRGFMDIIAETGQPT